MKRKHPFNMIEIMLALGVCAIGITSIMVLFPVGSAATRDAAMETYAAHAADQMLHFMKYRITANDGADWGTIISDATDPEITDTPPADDDYNLDDLNNPIKWITGTWASELKGTIYQHSSDTGIYQIMSHRNPAGKTLQDQTPLPPEFDVNKIDFRGILTIWKERIEIPDPSSSTGKVLVPYTMGVKLNIKVAWPAELPKDSRQVAYYSLEVFKP